MITPGNRLPLIAIAVSTVGIALTITLVSVVSVNLGDRQYSVETRLDGRIDEWNRSALSRDRSISSLNRDTAALRTELVNLRALVEPEPAPVPASAPPPAKAEPEPKPEVPTKPVQPARPEPAKIPDPDGGYLETAGLQSALEILGYSFRQRGEGLVVGKSMTTAVAIEGDPHATEIRVLGIAANDNDEANLVILASMAAVANAATTWGAQWITDHLQGLIQDSSSNYGRRMALSWARDGVRLELSVASTEAEYELVVVPE